MKGRQVNPAFFQRQTEASAFNNVQQNRNNIKTKFKNARKQGTLNLSSCQPPLAEIPREVLALDAFLEEDEKFWEVEPLRIVDFSFNALTQIPAEIANLTDCHTLKLRSNRLATLPNELFLGCRVIRMLDCGDNELSSLPESIQDASELRELLLNGNRLAALPGGLFHLTGLQKLDLNSNQLSSFSPGYGRPFRFPHLVTLNLSNNRLTALPADLSSCAMLEQLDCQNNLLTSLPSLAALPSLRSLDASQNRLTAFPPLPYPSNLARCVLSFNQLASLPQEVCATQSALSEFLLHNNHLTILPPEIELLGALKVLDVSNNNLCDLPPALGYLPALQILKAEGNPIKTIRQTILVKNAQEIKAYLRTRGPSIRVADGGASSSHVAPSSSSSCSSRPTGSASHPADSELLHRIRSMTAIRLDLSSLQLRRLDDAPTMEAIALMASNALPTQSLALLDLHDNQLTGFPLDVLAQLRAKKCNLARNALHQGQLRTAPATLSPRDVSVFEADFNLARCSCLQSLDLSHNGLTSSMLQVILSFAVQLSELVVSHNPVLVLPGSLARCSKLQRLDASFCQLHDVRALSFQHLPALASVDLSNNRISSFQAEHHALQWAQNLTSLNLENNDIMDIPLALGKLDLLQTLLLQGNPQKMIRSYIVQQGSNAILQNLRDKAVDYVMPERHARESGSATERPYSREPPPQAPASRMQAVTAPREPFPAAAPPSRSTAPSHYTTSAAGLREQAYTQRPAAMSTSRNDGGGALTAVRAQPISLAQSLARRRDGEDAGTGSHAPSSDSQALRARRSGALARLNQKHLG